MSQFILTYCCEKVIGSAVNIDDNFPPARVTDLQVVSMNADNMTITIRFTAPGSELDEGIGKIA